MSGQEKKAIMTTSNGAPLPAEGLTASATAGPNGPIVLSDFALIDHLAHFDRERIPERVVHAKGAGAFGYFETTADISDVCSAKLFSAVGKRTPVAARFSTVGGESGSSDTVRDPRGFAVKFYTEEGNWDLVGNNTPIFFIRDPILFPSFIHTQKRHPSTHLKDADMFWDFISLRPETTHQVSFLFSDRGIPDGYRHMNGYGSHTFQNTNAKGEVSFVKYHFKTDQGIRNLPVDEAAKLASSNPDYAIQDLYEAIARKEYPTWTMYIQVMSEAMAEAQLARGFNPFDVTKVWSHRNFPLREVGKLVLHRNPPNYFADVEQLAFAPSHFVPGIDASPDKMLQGRLFSYADTHRHRLGVNYQQIPVNQPIAPPQTYQRDGAMTVTGNMGGAPNYFPNSAGGPSFLVGLAQATSKVPSARVMKYSTKDDDNFSQCGDFYRKVLSEDARTRLVDNIAGNLVAAKPTIQERAIANFTAADKEYGQRIATKIAELRKAGGSPHASRAATAPLNPPRSTGYVPAPPTEGSHPRL
ncbi:catalase [Achlya hypogyna]|uniref:Catalase n=1 Tax=Achlya hypogyna TaxID=1202772 RepID=A0A1V9YFM2_ACHHY|nr:catalase [Achlya hypogyna]